MFQDDDVASHTNELRTLGEPQSEGFMASNHPQLVAEGNVVRRRLGATAAGLVLVFSTVAPATAMFAPCLKL